MSMQKDRTGIFSATVGWLLGLVVTLVIVFLTDIVDLENGYSPDVGFRLQTNAFFQGELAIRHHPMHHEHDMVWARNGLQQPWGLGVPILRMPFELAARAGGMEHFPDRWVLVFYMFIGVSLLIRGLQSVLRSVTNLSNSMGIMLLLLATWFSVASPMFIGMLSGRLVVYEEAVAYLLFFQWALLGMLLLFAATGQWRWFVCLCLCAGFAAYIRPSGVFPAVITMFCAFAVAWRDQCKPKTTIIYMASLFCVLPLLLMLLNYIRFESIINFGQFQVLTFLPLLIYVSNFSDPFQAVGLWDAVVELFGSLFYLQRIVEVEVWQSIYPKGWHGWEASALRMREYYFTSLPSYYLGLLVIAWCALASCWRGLSLPLKIATVWSTGGFLFLFGFYMYTPVLASRYLIDMLPQIVIPIVLLGIVVLPAVYVRLNTLAQWLFLGLVSSVIGFTQGMHFLHAQEFIPDFYKGRNQPVSYEHIEPKLRPKPISFGYLPNQYMCGQVAHNYNIPNNTWNWNPRRSNDRSDGCDLSVASTLFFPPFQCITLDTLLTPFTIDAVEYSTNTASFRMRSGRYELIKTAVMPKGEGRHSSTFCLPDGAKLHHRWNQVIIGWVPPEYLRHKAIAPVKLLGASITR